MTAAISAYVVVALAILRPLAGHFTWSFHSRERHPVDPDRPGSDDWVGGVLTALPLVALWPAAAMWLLSGTLLPPVGAEREAEIRQREARVAEMERELGLDDVPGDVEARELERARRRRARRDGFGGAA